MSNDLTLSRRAVAAGWKFTPGQRVFAESLGQDDNTIIPDGYAGNAAEMAQLRPDFRDPATRGVLLQQVRERRNSPHGYVTCKRSRCASRDYAPGVWDWTWAFWDDEETFVASGDSETAALLAAMEAAPNR